MINFRLFFLEDLKFFDAQRWVREMLNAPVLMRIITDIETVKGPKTITVHIPMTQRTYF